MDRIPIVSGAARWLGHAQELRRNRLGFLLRATREGEIVRLRLVRFRTVVVSSPALFQEILVEKAAAFEKGPGVRLLSKAVLGNGLLTSEGDFWRRQRKLISPLFHPARIAHYADCMAASAREGADRWRDGEVIDVSAEMMRITLSIIGRTLFDADTFNESNDVARALTTLLLWTNNQLMGVLPLPFWIPTPSNLAARRANEALEGMIHRMIAERRASPTDRPDLLTTLLRAQDEDGTQMTDKQVRDEAMTLFVAGHETTANLLAWTLYLLAEHPEQHRKVEAEVDALEGDLPAASDLPRLPVALRVLKEAMRLYPPAHTIARMAKESVSIGGHILPEGTLVILSPYGMHRRPDLFPNPDRFDPDRFTPENEKALPRHAYSPFGAGPRICIGNHFAMMEAQIVLAALVKRFHFDLVAGQTIEPLPLVTLRARHGIRMVARRRQAPVTSGLG